MAAAGGVDCPFVWSDVCPDVPDWEVPDCDCDDEPPFDVSVDDEPPFDVSVFDGTELNIPDRTP